MIVDCDDRGGADFKLLASGLPEKKGQTQDSQAALASPPAIGKRPFADASVQSHPGSGTHHLSSRGKIKQTPV